MKPTLPQDKFIGLKRHTHKERTEIIKKLVVSRLRKELKCNLIAIAANGSYARNEDSDFSDIELMVFVRNSDGLPFGFRKIIDGVLIEGLFVTEREYYEKTLEPGEGEEWYIAGSDKLMAITNPSFIKKLEKYKVKNLSKKCFRCARDVLYEIQESFGKLFMAIKNNNIENLFPILSGAVMEVLKLMAFINKKPYKSLGTFITEAKGFKIKPTGFDDFIEIIIQGKYDNLAELEIRTKKLFLGIEKYFMFELGKKIYDDDFRQVLKIQNKERRH